MEAGVRTLTPLRCELCETCPLLHLASIYSCFSQALLLELLAKRNFISPVIGKVRCLQRAWIRHPPFTTDFNSSARYRAGAAPTLLSRNHPSFRARLKTIHPRLATEAESAEL